MWLMFASFIHLEISHIALDSSGRECLKRYNTNTTPLLYLLYRLYDIFVSVSLLRTIPLCVTAGIFNFISYSISLVNP